MTECGVGRGGVTKRQKFHHLYKDSYLITFPCQPQLFFKIHYPGHDSTPTQQLHLNPSLYSLVFCPTPFGPTLFCPCPHALLLATPSLPQPPSWILGSTHLQHGLFEHLQLQCLLQRGLLDPPEVVQLLLSPSDVVQELLDDSNSVDLIWSDAGRTCHIPSLFEMKLDTKRRSVRSSDLAAHHHNIPFSWEGMLLWQRWII